MGVAGLWDIVNKTGQSRSLTHLAVVDGFEKNRSGKRAFRIGIDASLWYNHASFSKGGENPELRLLFFRLRSLAELPLLPLFIFDGRERPKVKRGSRMGKAGSHALTSGMKALLDNFGMEWRMALGEAEAELAHLNRAGVIDAIMTDDVDALVFGAVTIIKNPSLTLSGNKSNPALNLEGKASKQHVMVYTADAVRTHPDVSLTRGGLILFALLSGGDYDGGVDKFGKGIAHALARCGFGDQLLAAFERRTQQPINAFLPQWREAINVELRTNSRGFMSRSCPSISLPPTFPDLATLENYANPVCSARVGRQGGGQMRDNGELNLARVAGFCEDKFGEWGHASAIIKRFRDLLWEAAVIRVLRRAALEADEKEKEKRLAGGIRDWSVRGPLRPSRAEAVGAPASLIKKYLNMTVADRRRDAFVNRGQSQGQPRDMVERDDPHPLILKIVGTRQHVSTDRVLEYRVEVSPVQLVALARSGIKGKRPEPARSVDVDDAFMDPTEGSLSQKSPKKPPPDPASVMRMWIPVSMMHQVHPGLVEEYEVAQDTKRDKKAAAAAAKSKGKGKGRARASDDEEDSDLEVESSLTKAPAKATRKSAMRAPRATQVDLDEPGPSHYAAHSVSQSNAAGPFGSPDSAGERGFLCTFPNPDDPAVVAEYMLRDENDSWPTEDNPRAAGDVLFDRIVRLSQSQPSSNSHSEPHPQLTTKGKSSRVQKASAASQRQAASILDEDDLNNESPPPDRFDAMFDQIMGGSSSRMSRTATTSRTKKRPRASAPNAAGTGVSKPKAAKRRKTTHGAEPATSEAVDNDVGDDVGRAPDRFDLMFDQIMNGSKKASRGGKKSVNASSFREKRTSGSASAAFEEERPAATRRAAISGASSSFPLPLPAKRPAAIDSGDVVEIFSDDEDDISTCPPVYSKGFASLSRASARRQYAEPSSSQDSGLFLDGVDVLVDLT